MSNIPAIQDPNISLSARGDQQDRKREQKQIWKLQWLKLQS